MEEPLDGLNNCQSQFFYMVIPNLDIIEIPNKIIYGLLYPYIVFLDKYHCYSRNGNNEIEEIVMLEIRGV